MSLVRSGGHDSDRRGMSVLKRRRRMAEVAEGGERG